MAIANERDIARINERRARGDFNVFSRLTAGYAASRTQEQHLLQKGGGLSIVEWRTLWDLHDVGPMTIRDLASIQRTDHSLLSRALPEFRRKGYVTMRRSEEDGRQTIVALTDAGRAAYQKAAPIMKRRGAALREVFSEKELAVFVGYLDRLENFLRQPIETIIENEQA